MIRVFKIEEKVWVYEGPSAWYFITIDKKVSNKIKQIPILRRGWGSVPVNVTLEKFHGKHPSFQIKKVFIYSQ